MLPSKIYWMIIQKKSVTVSTSQNRDKLCIRSRQLWWKDLSIKLLKVSKATLFRWKKYRLFGLKTIPQKECEFIASASSTQRSIKLLLKENKISSVYQDCEKRIRTNLDNFMIMLNDSNMASAIFLYQKYACLQN